MSFLTSVFHSIYHSTSHRQSPTRVALRRVASNTSVATTEPRNSRLFPLFGTSRSRSPSPIKVGLTPGFFKSSNRSNNPSVSPKRMAKARSELFSPVYEDSKESRSGLQLKRFASFKSNASQPNVESGDCFVCKSDAEASKKKVKSPSKSLAVKSGLAKQSVSDLDGSCKSNASKGLTESSQPCALSQNTTSSQPNASNTLSSDSKILTPVQNPTVLQPKVSNSESFKDSKHWTAPIANVPQPSFSDKDSKASTEKAAAPHCSRHFTPSKHSQHSNGSQLKRICSDPLCPRSPVPEDQVVGSAPGPGSPTEKVCHSPAKGAISAAHRRSSDSDLSSTPKGEMLK